jgi:hypothetical protein
VRHVQHEPGVPVRARSTNTRNGRRARVPTPRVV